MHNQKPSFGETGIVSQAKAAHKNKIQVKGASNDSVESSNTNSMFAVKRREFPMGASFDDLAAAIAAEMWWSSLGYWILAIGLAGDILVLVIPRHRERLEKILSAVFIVIIIFGVTIEHNAD